MEHVEHRLRDWRSQHLPLLMGVLNVTPDSFFDGGEYLDGESAAQRVETLIHEGADIIDIGAESSRPGSRVVPAVEQIQRLEPVLVKAVARGVFVSVDTTDAEVAEYCLARGARMINDVSCLSQPKLASATAAVGGWLVLNHSRTPMSEMSGFSQWPDDDYTDIVEDVMMDWGQASARAVAAGMQADRLVFDPGLGFSKNARHCFEILGRLSEFHALGVPTLVGPGRKSFIADVDGSPPGERLGGTVAACLSSANAGAAVLRVHDVAAVRQALGVWQRIKPTRSVRG